MSVPLPGRQIEICPNVFFENQSFLMLPSGSQKAMEKVTPP